MSEIRLQNLYITNTVHSVGAINWVQLIFPLCSYC